MTLLIFFCCLCRSEAATEPKLNGGFVVPYTSVGWTQQRWVQEFAFMKTLGMNIVIMAHSTVTDSAGNSKAYYPTAMSGFTHTATAATDFENMMTAADAAGMEMHLGLSVDESEWYSWWPADKTYSTKLRTRSITIMDELLAMYGAHPSLKGIYFPQELDNARYVRDDFRGYLVDDVLKPVSDHLHAVRPELLFSNAPFYNPAAQQPADYQQWWIQVLTACPNFDLVIPQDGIGARSEMTLANVADYFCALRNACVVTGRTLWSDLEMFDSLVRWEPPPISRTLDQLTTEAPFVDKFVVWAWIYCSPNYSMWSLEFFHNYRRYLAGETTWLQNESVGKSYTFSAAPSASYADPQGTRLTDGVASIDYLGGECVGWSGLTGNLTVTLDLGVVKNNLTKFCTHNPKQSGAAVVEPAWVTVAVSSDGSTFRSIGSATDLGISDNSIVNYMLEQNEGIGARYVRFTMPYRNWLMLTEISVYSAPTPAAVGDWSLF